MSAASETPVTSAGFGTKFGGDPSGTPLYHLLPVAGCYTDLAGTFIGVNSHGGVTLSALSSIEPALFKANPLLMCELQARSLVAR